MSRIKYLSVVETDDGSRQIRLGRVDGGGEEMRMPTPENDLDDFERYEWTRKGVFTLPEPMPKSEFQDWWNDHKDDEPQPSPIPEVLETMNTTDVEEGSA